MEENKFVLTPFRDDAQFLNRGLLNASLQKSCYKITADVNANLVELCFFNLPYYDYQLQRNSSTYEDVLKYIDYCISLPDNRVTVNVSQLASPSAKSVYTLTGTLVREDPRLNADLPLNDMSYLKVSLTNIEIALNMAFIEEPKDTRTVYEKVAQWFKGQWSKVVKQYRKIFPKPAATELPFGKTSYASVFTRHELENRVFDADDAHKIIDEVLEGIEDPKDKILKVRGIEVRVKG